MQLRNKTIFTFLFILSIQLMGFSQTMDGYKAENEGWMVSLDKAYAESKKSGKAIMANFTGSDWCGWCKKLTANVFSQQEFKKWADKNVVLLELDFPRRKQLPADITAQNQSLGQAFKVSGFPTVWVFDLEKDAKGQFSITGLGKTGFANNVKDFTTGVDQMLARRVQ